MRNANNKYKNSRKWVNSIKREGYSSLPNLRRKRKNVSVYKKRNKETNENIQMKISSFTRK
jgi:hypothetical protein